MQDRSDKKSKDLRKQHNSDLIRRMRNGESLTAIDSKASWYPPRPVIQKDYKEMTRLYKRAIDAAPAATESHAAGPGELVDVDSTVVRLPSRRS